jgi:hypothetical protein
VGESPLFDPDDQYDERNHFLYFILGVLSISNNLSHHLVPSQEKHSPVDAEGIASAAGSSDLRDLLR